MTSVAIRRERDQLTNATHAARLEVVELILQGAPLTLERASRRLHYDLARNHLAAVVWSDVTAPPDMERVADALARAAGTSRPLNLPISSSTSWVWLSSRSPLEAEAIRDAMEHDEQVRVALGTPAPSLTGFRKSHLEAMATQRLARRLPNPSPVTTYEDVEVVALATGEEERAVEFVARTLGPLAQAPAELRDTLRIYLREQCSSTRTARVFSAIATQ
jgi:DNA-binding PucR family transcriptional regulator